MSLDDVTAYLADFEAFGGDETLAEKFAIELSQRAYLVMTRLETEAEAWVRENTADEDDWDDWDGEDAE